MLGSRAGGKQENQLKYNGKELQSDFDLEWTDYGARMYDGQIGRWHVVDPHAYNYQNVTPYNYVMNNPLSYIDPNGMDYYFDYDGNYLGSDGIGDKLQLTQKSDYDAAQKTAKNSTRGKEYDSKKAKSDAINSSVHHLLTCKEDDGSSKSREITISGDEAQEAQSAGISTVDYLYNQTNTDGKERNVFIYLNTNTATVEFGKVNTATMEADGVQGTVSIDKSSKSGYVLIGNIHGHPDKKIDRFDLVDGGMAGNSEPDRNLAGSRGISVYSTERAGRTDANASIYVNYPSGRYYSQYNGGRDARSIKQDAVWQKIKGN
jgi:RHS repeat-associated protein